MAEAGLDPGAGDQPDFLVDHRFRETESRDLGADHPAGQASITHIDHVRDIVRQRATAAGLNDVEDFASSWHILMKGAIILAAVGDLDAAQRARKMARGLIEEHRPVQEEDIGEAVG